jgi:hypothetical protein
MRHLHGLRSIMVLGASGMMLLSACEGPIVLRSRADASVTAPSNPDDPLAAQCTQLREQIRVNQESLREAPAISTSPQIVAAAEGKADQRIDELRNRMDELGCSAEYANADAGERVRMMPLPPAPNAPNP